MRKKKPKVWLHEADIILGESRGDEEKSASAVFSNLVPNKFKKGIYRLVAEYGQEEAIYSELFVMRTQNYSYPKPK